jgi:hypothetical protein
MVVHAEALQAALKARKLRPPETRQRLIKETISGLEFSAAFDNGNVARVSCNGPDEFLLHARADCEGTPHATRSRTWFCFSIRGATTGRTLNLEVRISNQQKLFDHGMRPCYRSLPSRPEWARLPTATPCKVDGATTDSFAIQITHIVDTPASDTLYFAFCFPLGYADQMARLAWADALFRQPAAELAPPSPPEKWADAVGHLSRLAVTAAASPTTDVGRESAPPSAAGSVPTPVSAEQIRTFRHQKLLGAARTAALAASASFAESELPTTVDVDADAAASHSVAIAAAAARLTANLLPSEVGDDPKHRIYYRRELLTRSLEGRRIDLVTITGIGGQLSAEEAPLPAPLLPEGGQRPARFDKKKYVLVSGRVHPGETPASHVLDGLLAFLLRPDDPRACALRERFVFKIIPMLNPDGVFHGHYRSDTRGADLNRKYSSALESDSDTAAPRRMGNFPSCHACLEVARQLHANPATGSSEGGGLHLYIDTHAHAGRRGCFFYGNQIDDPRLRDDSALFARLVALNTRWFDFDGCTWFGSDAHGGSARAAVFAATGGMPHVYTLECNYDSGVKPNTLPPRHGTEQHGGIARVSPEPAAERVISPKYTAESWQEIGKAIALAVLDMANANPCSRLGPMGGDGLAKLRVAVAAAQQQKAERKAQKKPKAAKGGLQLGTRERWGDDDDDDEEDEDERDEEEGDEEETTADVDD